MAGGDFQPRGAAGHRGGGQGRRERRPGGHTHGVRAPYVEPAAPEGICAQRHNNSTRGEEGERGSEHINALPNSRVWPDREGGDARCSSSPPWVACVCHVWPPSAASRGGAGNEANATDSMLGARSMASPPPVHQPRPSRRTSHLDGGPPIWRRPLLPPFPRGAKSGFEKPV